MPQKERPTKDASAITDVLDLRSMPWLEHLQTSSLEALAEQFDHLHVQAGAVLLEEGQLMNRVFLVREGALRVRHRHVERLATVDRPVDLLCLLAGHVGLSVVADVDTRLFSIHCDAVWEALEEDFVVLVHSVEQLARTLEDADFRRPSELREAPREFNELVPRIMWLRSTRALGRAPVRAVAALAKRARVIELSRGDVLWDEGEASSGMCFVLSGSILEGARRVRSGELLGELAALSDRHRRNTCRSAEGSRVLWLDVDTVWDVLEDHFELARHVLKRLSRAVLVTTTRTVGPESARAVARH